MLACPEPVIDLFCYEVCVRAFTAVVARCPDTGLNVGYVPDTCPSCGVARASIQTRVPSPTQAAAVRAADQRDVDEPVTRVEQSAAQFVKSRPLRIVIVTLLIGPALAGIALGVLAFVLWLLVKLLRP
jgi:hypothetical protein